MLIDLIPWIVSLAAIASFYIPPHDQGLHAVMGLVILTLWSLMIFYFGLWGLIPVSIFYLVMITRNVIREDRNARSTYRKDSDN